MTPRRKERRERVEVKHNPEAFVLTEEQAIAEDRLLNELKPTPEYLAPSYYFALSEEVQRNRGAL